MKAQDKTGQIMELIIYSFIIISMTIMIALTTMVMLNKDSIKGSCKMKQVDTTLTIKNTK